MADKKQKPQLDASSEVHAPPRPGREHEGPPRVMQLCAVDFTVRQFIAPLALSLKSRGCQVFVCCSRGPYWNELRSWGLHMLPLKISRSYNLVSHVISAVRLFSILKKYRIDILHVHTPIAGLIGRFVGKLAGVKHIIYTSHGFYFHDRMGPISYHFHVILEKIAAKFHNYMFLVSEEDVRAAERLKIDNPSRMFLVRNGVDRGRFHPEFKSVARKERREEFGIPLDAPVVAIMGRMTREKGFFEFFEAARLVLKVIPDAHFLAIGDTLSSERDRIKRKIRALVQHPDMKGHAHMAGFRKDIPDILSACDVFCLPSYREGLPVSVMEAMMMGLPVIASRIRGCREEVAEGSSGLLVTPGSVKELASAISYLLRHPETARKMGAAGRRRALELYSLEPVLDAQWRVYKGIIEEDLR